MTGSGYGQASEEQISKFREAFREVVEVVSCMLGIAAKSEKLTGEPTNEDLDEIEMIYAACGICPIEGCRVGEILRERGRIK